MIAGRVNSNLEPVIALEIFGRGAIGEFFEFVVDTCFSGFLSMPPDWIAKLGLTRTNWDYGTLADGSRIRFACYEATVEIDGKRLSIDIEELDSQPLIGMSLLRDCRIEIDAVPGGPVKITRL